MSTENNQPVDDPNLRKMKNRNIVHMDGDVHIDGVAIGPNDAIQLALRITAAAQEAREYRRSVLRLVAHAGEMLAHDSMRDQRPDEREIQ